MSVNYDKVRSDALPDAQSSLPADNPLLEFLSPLGMKVVSLGAGTTDEFGQFFSGFLFFLLPLPGSFLVLI